MIIPPIALLIVPIIIGIIMGPTTRFAVQQGQDAAKWLTHHFSEPKPTPQTKCIEEKFESAETMITIGKELMIQGTKRMARETSEAAVGYVRSWQFTLTLIGIIAVTVTTLYAFRRCKKGRPTKDLLSYMFGTSGHGHDPAEDATRSIQITNQCYMAPNTASGPASPQQPTASAAVDKPHIEPPEKFTPDHNVEKWLRRFDNYVTQYDTTFWKPCLIAALGQWWDEVEVSPEASYDDIKRHIKDAYKKDVTASNAPSTISLMNKFMNRRRRLDETITRYAEELKSLVDEALPTTPQAERDSILRERFMEGLDSEETITEVRQLVQLQRSAGNPEIAFNELVSYATKSDEHRKSRSKQSASQHSNGLDINNNELQFSDAEAMAINSYEERGQGHRTMRRNNSFESDYRPWSHSGRQNARTEESTSSNQTQRPDESKRHMGEAPAIRDTSPRQCAQQAPRTRPRIQRKRQTKQVHSIPVAVTRQRHSP